jgi:hypothetical protein
VPTVADGWERQQISRLTEIDRLSDDRRIPLGGPAGDVDGQHGVLVVLADSVDGARAMFADDPWTDSMLGIESIELDDLLATRVACLGDASARAMTNASATPLGGFRRTGDLSWSVLSR